MNEDAARNLEEMELLAPGLIHEMRQPLLGMRAGLQFLAKRFGKDLLDLDDWSLVTGQLDRIEEMFLSYQALLTPDRVVPCAFDVAPVVQRTVELLRFRLKRLGDRFRLHVEADLPPAFGIPNALIHGVTNLVVNALDAIEGVPARLAIRVIQQPTGHTQVRVSDEGPGISSEARERLFLPRFTTKPKGKGTGLGLYIARRMMRAIGGDVVLVEDNDPLRETWAKTEFRVDLPAPSAAETAAAGLATQGPIPVPGAAKRSVLAAVHAPPPPQPLSQTDPLRFAELAISEFTQAAKATPRVLVVDDEHVVLKVFSDLLPSLGIEFELAESAEEAAQDFSPGRFNLAIVDKNLPEGTGMELVNDLKRWDPLIEVMVITGYASVESILEAIRLGACDYVEKPIENVDVLMARVQAIVKQQALRARTVRLRKRLVILEEEVLATAPAQRKATLERLLGLTHPPPLKGRIAVLGDTQVVDFLKTIRRLEVAPIRDVKELEQLGADVALDLLIVDPSACELPLNQVAEAVQRFLGHGAWSVATHATSKSHALAAIGAGASDYIVLKPDSDRSLVAERIIRASQRAREQRTNRDIVNLLLNVDIAAVEGKHTYRAERSPVLAVPRAQRKATRSGTAQPSARLLVVDDEEVILTVLRKAFTMEGHEVVLAKSAEQAAALLKEQPFDVLVTDKNLPGLGGVQLAGLARAGDPDIAIVVVTGYASKESAEELLQFGIDDYVIKPFNVDEFTAKIEDILARRRKLAETRHQVAPTASRMVLIVEPNADDASRLGAAVMELGYEPVTATGVVAGLKEHQGVGAAVVNWTLCTEEAKALLRERKVTQADFRLLMTADQKSLQGTIGAILLGARAQLVRPLPDSADLRVVLAGVLSKSGRGS